VCNNAFRSLTTTLFLSGMLTLPMLSFAADSNLPALRLLASPRPLVIGHRGYCQFAPENTLPSFKLALAAGADLVELDYYHAKDGQLIVIHDADLDRTTDATNRWGGKRIRIETRTADEIQTLDAGSWFDPKFKGTKVPLLREALDTIQAGGVTLIERKEGDAAACIKLLKQKNLINKVVVQAFDWAYLRRFSALSVLQNCFPTAPNHPPHEARNSVPNGSTTFRNAAQKPPYGAIKSQSRPSNSLTSGG
jgi:glycerophosphoryl diester phosphodiesterase